MHSSAKTKYQKLERKLKEYGKTLIAYSGGVDSTFLISAAIKTLGPQNVLAITAVSETYPAAELKQAKDLSRILKVPHRIIRTEELKNKRFSSNPQDRCFYCKDELFRKLSQEAKKRGMILCDATNYSDRTDYRPGRRAAKKWHVASPLAEARMTKDDIRALSKAMRLKTWNLPAQACLASRIPYGTELTTQRLSRIEQGEIIMKKLGFSQIRLRDHGDIVRIETDSASIERLAQPRYRQAVARGLKKLGWRYLALDLEGYRTGSLNPA